MAKEISFKLGTDSFTLSPVKVERKKIYGWTEMKVTDTEGGLCRTVSLDSNGITVIPNGAIKMGMLSDSGRWVEKSELQYVHSDGSKAEMYPSSFDTGIILDKKATAEDLLDLLVTSVYVLSGDDAAKMAEKIGNDIYSFRFNYRADYEDSPAFLISNGSTIFILTGRMAKFEFLSLENQGTLDVGEDEAEDIDLEELDFSMM